MRNLALDKEELNKLAKPAWMELEDFEYAKRQMQECISSILELANDLDAAWMTYRQLRILVDAEKEGCQLYGVPAKPKSKNRKRTKSKG